MHDQVPAFGGSHAKDLHLLVSSDRQRYLNLGYREAQEAWLDLVCHPQRSALWGSSSRGGWEARNQSDWSAREGCGSSELPSAAWHGYL